VTQLPVARRPLFAVCLVIAAAAAITGCGVGAGPGTRDAHLLVTTDFGTHRIGEDKERQVPGAETVMSLLQRHFRVGTRYGGGFVESIDGHAGNSDRVDWFYFVNGIEAGHGAAATDIHAGDHIWWDLHSWAAAESIPAVVGSYPEPFTSGAGGKKLPTVRECAAGMQIECDLVGSSLRSFGVRAPERSLGAKAGSHAQAVVVGTWSQIKGLEGAGLLAQGPAVSGVYAQFVGADGQRVGGAALGLEDPAGAVAQTLRGNVGLIAATQTGSTGQSIWLVTGTDASGVMDAARAFTAARLDGHFAVAVDGARVIPLPVDASS
jgi:hypothetical protein